MMRPLALVVALVGILAVTVVAAAPVKIESTPSALARAMEGQRVVLLGEVHDNPAQHALRAAALRLLVERGARPALAFEQFDREQQPNIDRARRERPRDADYVIAQAHGSKDWNWTSYRPFVALALEYDLPIVAANLSRRSAMQVAMDGWSAAFDTKAVASLGLDALPADFRRKQEEAIALGHCNLLPPEMIAPRANAQIARDIVMARSMQPYLDRGVVLLAGNGHVRRDIGVRYWLRADKAPPAISIGLLETEDGKAAPDSVAEFDAYVVTDRAERDDPCKQIAQRPPR